MRPERRPNSPRLPLLLQRTRAIYEDALAVERGLKEEAILESARLRELVKAERDGTLWHHLNTWWRSRRCRTHLRVFSMLRLWR